MQQYKDDSSMNGMDLVCTYSKEINGVYQLSIGGRVGWMSQRDGERKYPTIYMRKLAILA